MDSEDNKVRQLISEITASMTAFSTALEGRAAEIQASGKDAELAEKLVKGADVMRDSRDIYLSWARHYASLSEGNPEGAEDEDEVEFGV
ncbi:MAG: hypothetical protein ACREJU_16135 [Nitrospiraceae bacterium]